MTAAELTRAQCRVLENKLKPMAGYLHRLRVRIRRRGFPDDDPLMSLVVTGLALAGALLRQTRLAERLREIEVEGSKRPTLPHGEVLVSMIGLLCLGKSDYADVEAFRQETFFAQALGLRGVPSEETLRQRLDQLGTVPVAVLHEESADMVRRHAPPLVPCHRQYVPLDVDVSPFDNSGTQKEGVAWTYKEHEGYAPALAYLGQEGYLLACELRPGDQHVQKGTPEFLVRAVELARRVTDAKLLVRMDAGNDDAQNLRVLRKSRVAWIIKRNLRRESQSEWLEIAHAHGHCRELRERKEIYTGGTSLEREGRLQRVIFEVVHRTIDRDGQRLLVPDVEIASWWTSLSTREASPEEVIALYRRSTSSPQQRLRKTHRLQ